MLGLTVSICYRFRLAHIGIVFQFFDDEMSDIDTRNPRRELLLCNFAELRCSAAQSAALEREDGFPRSRE
jgi:hypothetical protein